MNREDICLTGQVFAEDEKLILSRYTEIEKDMYIIILDEIMEEYPTMNHEFIKNRFWKETI